MEQDEKTLDTQEVQEVSEPVAAEEAVAEESETTTQGEVAEETPEAKLAKAQAEAAKYRRLFEKTQKPQVVRPAAPQKVSPQPSVEEAVLLANGMPEELLTELKAVAAVRKTGLIKAQADPIFVAVKEKFEKEKKHADASLSGSRGSGSVKARKTPNTPGLSREEHKAMVMESL